VGVLEARRGYRFSPENLTLPLVLGKTTARNIVDLGAGSGSLLVLAAVWTNARQAVGVEVQSEVAARLERTLEAYSTFESRVVEGDLRTGSCLDEVRNALGSESADLVVLNPPFFPSGWGRPSSNTAKRLSTHAECGGVMDFLFAAKSLAPQGKILMVYDAGRMAEAVSAASEVGLGLEGVWWIGDQRPARERAPFRVWLQFGESGLRSTRIA
jgi:tRNA1Val (adenine37-N6)-methyltransferase